MENMIEIVNLTKTYKIYEKPLDRLKEVIFTKKNYSKDFAALSNITLEIKKGEILGIIGVNGSGKSTLLKIITGVLQPSEGHVEVRGKVAALLELGAGFNQEYTGLKNIYLNGAVMGFSKEEMDSKVQSILEFADIGEFIHQPVKTYSSGMFARLAFAVAINVEPEILVVDETLAVGDVRFQMKCIKKMKSMMDNGTTVLFVSHDTNIIRRFCTRVIWLNKGQFVAEGEVDQLVDRYLDFLKTGEIIEENEELELSTVIDDENISLKAKGEYASIIDVKMLCDGREITEVNYNQKFSLKIQYEVFDESIKNPVLGVGMASVDNEYLCGVNTLLDGQKIPWKSGKNEVEIEYPQGILALGGRYYFDVALMDETATVNLDYKALVKQFSVRAKYKGEGRYIIPHKWILNNDK